MKKLKRIGIALAVLSILPLGHLAAHTPICSCFDNDDGTITCEGGFSDGSSAEGVEMRVERPTGRVLIKGMMDEVSEFNFKKPSGSYLVIFNAGDGHMKTIDGKTIQ